MNSQRVKHLMKRKTEERKDRAIFLLCSPDKKYFYINHCSKNTLREVYRHNIRGRIESSEHFINTIKPNRPCLFELENLPNSTLNEAYNRILIWQKILLDNGHTSCNHEPLIKAAQQLAPRNVPLYEERKDTNLTAITSCEKCLAATYNKQICPYYKPTSDERG